MSWIRRATVCWWCSGDPRASWSLLARLSARWAGCSHVIAMPACSWIVSSAAVRATWSLYADATAAASLRPPTEAGDDAATALETGRCRPGDPAACSFNRRDWVVLLKLKPQRAPGIQLYTPAATEP